MAEMNMNESMPLDGVKLLDDEVVATFVEVITRVRERLEEVQSDFAVRFLAEQVLIREPGKLVDHIWSKADGVRRDLVELRDRQAQLEREQAQLAQQRADLELRATELDMLKGIHQRMDRFESSLALRPVTQDLSMARRETAEGLKKLRSETAQELAKLRGETLQELTTLKSGMSQLSTVHESLDGLADHVSDSVRGIVTEGLHEALSPLRASLASLDVPALDSLATGPLSEGFSSLEGMASGVKQALGASINALQADVEAAVGRIGDHAQALHKLSEQNAAEMGNRLCRKADALASKLDDSGAVLRSGQDALAEQMSELTASLSSVSVRRPADPSASLHGPSTWLANVSHLPDFLHALAPAPGSVVDHGDIVGILAQAYMFPNQRDNLEAFLRDAPHGKRFCLLAIARKGHTHPVVAEGRCFCFADQDPEDRDCVTVSVVAGQAYYVLTQAASETRDAA